MNSWKYFTEVSTASGSVLITGLLECEMSRGFSPGYLNKYTAKNKGMILLLLSLRDFQIFIDFTDISAALQSCKWEKHQARVHIWKQVWKIIWK